MVFNFGDFADYLKWFEGNHVAVNETFARLTAEKENKQNSAEAAKEEAARREAEQPKPVRRSGRNKGKPAYKMVEQTFGHMTKQKETKNPLSAPVEIETETVAELPKRRSHMEILVSEGPSFESFGEIPDETPLQLEEDSPESESAKVDDGEWMMREEQGPSEEPFIEAPMTQFDPEDIENECAQQESEKSESASVQASEEPPASSMLDQSANETISIDELPQTQDDRVQTQKTNQTYYEPSQSEGESGSEEIEVE